MVAIGVYQQVSISSLLQRSGGVSGRAEKANFEFSSSTQILTPCYFSTWGLESQKQCILLSIILNIYIILKMTKWVRAATQVWMSWAFLFPSFGMSPQWDNSIELRRNFRISVLSYSLLVCKCVGSGIKWSGFKFCVQHWALCVISWACHWSSPDLFFS